ncbi:MAG TPA: class I adenylate-forming enzyme family protein [Spirochaetota bacterium]|nr:class I adenylate-forming enzyme family protein [Spirochaetota bacterium]
MDWKKLDLTWHYIEKWAAETPAAEALVFEETRLTWADFKAQMDLAAKAFIEAGVKKGDRVAMLSMARTEFPITYMAANKIGAIWLGLNPKFTLEELRFQLNDSKPTVLVAVRDFMGNDLSETIKTLTGECPSIKKLLVIGDPMEGSEDYAEFIGKPRADLDRELERRAAAVNGKDSALLMYTSGSTGKPKGVVHTHYSIIENIKVEVERFYFGQGWKVLLHFPINHVAADVEIGYAAIMMGGCMVCMDRFDPAGSLAMIEKEKLNVIGQVPVMYLLQMTQPGFKDIDWSSMKLFAWAGSAAPKAMIDVFSAICKKTGANLMTGYGSTEVCGFVTYTEKGDDEETLLATAGKIAPPFELKIVDDERRELPDGQIGEIAVRGAFMFKEYFNNPKATAEVLDSDGWYYTSDLAFKDERGYIHITGRKSEMFKTGGENVYPREVEEVIETQEAVLFAAVMGVPDELYQEVGWAFVMPTPGKSVTEEELREHVKNKLANYKQPKKYFVRPLLPLLANGKVNKLALREEIKEMLKK